MALADYHDVSLANYIALGARIKVIYKTSVTRMRESHEERIGEWQDALRTFDIAPVLRDQDEHDDLIAFFRARNGPKYVFKIPDPIDSIATAEYFGTGNGSQTQYQLIKSYDSGLTGDNYPIIRPIALPDAGIQLFHDDILYTTGVTVDLLTGIVTFSSAPAGAVVLTWTGTFQVPVRFTTMYMASLVEVYQGNDVELILEEQRAPVASYILAETQSPDFVEVNFPTDWAERSSMGPNYDVIIIPGDGGESNRVAQFVEAKIKFEVDFSERTLAQIQTILYFFLARRGRLVGFRVRDITDYTATNQLIGIGDGIRTAFQLLKIYQSGGESQIRTITKPVEATFFFDGIAADPQPNLDLTTGELEFDDPPEEDVLVTWTGTFDVPVRFDTDTFEADITGYEVHGWQGIGLVEIMTDLPAIEIADVSQSIQTAVSGCATRPFPEVQPVTKYILFPGTDAASTTTSPFQLRTNVGHHYGSTKVITNNLTSITIAFAVSHLTAAGCFFKMPQGNSYPDGGGPAFRDVGARIELFPVGDIRCTIGSGGVRVTPQFSTGDGSGQCRQADVAQKVVYLPTSGDIDQDDMHIYCVTFDWYNRAIYSSGSVSGFGEYNTTDIYYQTCAGIGIIGKLPNVLSAPVRFYENPLFIPGGGDGGVLGVNVNSDTAVGAEAGVFGGFSGAEAYNGWGGRLYEIILMYVYSPLPINSILRSIHTSVLGYLGSLYGVGYPRRRRFLAPSTTLLYRADSPYIVLFNDVQTDAVLFWSSNQGIDLTCGRSGGSFNWNHPTQVTISEGLPILNTDLVLAKVPAERQFPVLI